MAGSYGAHAATYLLVLVGVTTILFALPLFLTPVRWGRVMRFGVPADTDLAVYFGRCLGAVILVVEAIAGPEPGVPPRLTLWACDLVGNPNAM